MHLSQFQTYRPTKNNASFNSYEGAILPKSQNTIYNSFGQNFRLKQEKQAVSILRFPISRQSIKYSLHTQSRIYFCIQYSWAEILK